MPSSSVSVNDSTTISLRLLLSVAGVLLIPMIGFGVHIMVTLSDISTEVKLLRQEFGQHTDGGHHAGAVSRGQLRAALVALGQANPSLEVPQLYFDD